MGLCGPKHHYITDHLSGDIEEPDQFIKSRPYLYFQSWPNGNPYDSAANPDITAYELVLYTDDEIWFGQYKLDLHVELENYPSSTPSYQTFTVIIDPCIVTYLTAPGNTTLEYDIGSETMFYEFNFP